MKMIGQMRMNPVDSVMKILRRRKTVNSNLKPIRTTERAKELGRKGGLTKTPRKALSSRLNGLSNKKLTAQQKHFVALLKEKRFLDLLVELLALNIEGSKDWDKRNQVIDQLIKIMPKTNLSFEVLTKDEGIDWCKVVNDLAFKGWDEKEEKDEVKTSKRSNE